MSFYGSADDIIKKVLFLDVSIEKDEYLDGKHMAMLINDRKIEFDSGYDNVSIKEYTRMVWMPINSLSPTSNMVTFTNHEFYKKEDEFSKY